MNLAEYDSRELMSGRTSMRRSNRRRANEAAVCESGTSMELDDFNRARIELVIVEYRFGSVDML